MIPIYANIADILIFDGIAGLPSGGATRV